MKKKKEKKQKSKIPPLASIIWVIVLILIIKSTTIMLHLKYSGIRIKGVVINVYGVGSKGQAMCEYRFTLHGKYVDGETTFDDFRVGDSVFILYSPYNYEINTLQQKILDGWSM